MISCDSFHSRFHEATEDAALLEHVRTCDPCLDFAAGVDPDILFCAIGVGEMIPPGGVEAFVDDVMRQVRVREAETTVDSRRRVVLTWPRRMAIAATVALGISGASFYALRDSGRLPVTAQPIAAVHAATAAVQPVNLVSAVERYDSDNATIVEVPTEASSDTTIVMIFDENLPADL